RFIALNVDYHFDIIEVCSDFGDSISATLMFLISQGHLNSVTTNSRKNLGAIGGYDNSADVAGGLGARCDPANHGFTGDFQERFSGETSGGKPSRDDSNNVTI